MTVPRMGDRVDIHVVTCEWKVVERELDGL